MKSAAEVLRATSDHFTENCCGSLVLVAGDLKDRNLETLRKAIRVRVRVAEAS